ncbi:unnamed protein product [Brachionus calyciflorus]|uniref:C2H2-type domain-containing protein n=1 Tax=Brachionus calyciflorus TaxID=104777 RepID=A0A814NGL2_9BILA|nr:unnamed protein product [Brachionus calyciflorus]
MYVLELSFKYIENNLNVAQVRQKACYDKFVKNLLVFSVGDLVLLINKRRKPGESSSFMDKAIWPFEILESFNEVNFKVKCLEHKREFFVYYNRLIPFKSRDDVLEFSKLMNSKCNNGVQTARRAEVGLENEVIFELDFYSLLVASAPVVDSCLLEFNASFNCDEADYPARSFKCDVCERTFESIRGLKQHKTKMGHTELFWMLWKMILI